jgi:hypothetical protein
MSYSLLNGLYIMFQADAALQTLVGKRPDGSLSIATNHFQDVADPVFPLVTMGRFGSGMKDGLFDEDALYAGRMDNPKIEICVWDKASLDDAYAAYRRIDQLLRGSPYPVALPSAHITNYRFKRVIFRDDLWDDALAAYHIHSEYTTWVYDNPVNPVPIPA